MLCGGSQSALGKSGEGQCEALFGPVICLILMGGAGGRCLVLGAALEDRDPVLSGAGVLLLVKI